MCREHSAQVRFFTLTALMAIFVLVLLGVVITVTNLGDDLTPTHPRAWLAAHLSLSRSFRRTDPKGKHSTNKAARTRTYYIAADEIMWDYAPDGINKITGRCRACMHSLCMKVDPECALITL